MSGKHTVNIHMERSGARLFILGLDESDIHALGNHVFNNRIIMWITADSVPAQANQPPILFLGEQGYKPLKLRTLNNVFYPSVIFDCDAVGFKGRVFFLNHSVLAKTLNRLGFNRK